MKTSNGVGAVIFAALILGGCAASPSQGAQVRVRTTTAAFEHYVPAQSAVAKRTRSSARKESPQARECKSGSSKACNEIGDRLAMKYAHAEAYQWYMTSCERVRSAMVPTATRLMGLSQDLKQLASARSEEASAANQKRLAELKNDASEMRARIQGCLDVGETLKLDAEPKQSLAYYEAVCEFSTLVGVVGEAVPGLQHITESGCAASQSARAELSMTGQFTPQQFVHLTQPQAPARPAATAKHSAPKSEEGGMVFTEGDL
jgi:hypothetical protein